MSDKNLLIGDTTCPHNTSLVDQLRAYTTELENAQRHSVSSVAMSKAADRIEQLERQLIEAQKGHARYEYVRKLNVPEFSNFYDANICFGTPFDDLVDAAIQEGK